MTATAAGRAERLAGWNAIIFAGMAAGCTILATCNRLCRACHFEKTRVENGGAQIAGRAEWTEYVKQLESDTMANGNNS